PAHAAVMTTAPLSPAVGHIRRKFIREPSHPSCRARSSTTFRLTTARRPLAQRYVSAVRRDRGSACLPEAA
ncbi:MAG: hypothetical protein AAGJ94_16800, partial [Pseudomonadota bacterium]